MMSKRRKILINNTEVSAEEGTEILEYMDTNQSYEIDDENHEQFICTSGEQLSMENGTIVQYIEPEYAVEEDEIIPDQEQEDQQINNCEMKYSYTIINGEREGSFFLYCNKQLYKKNRSKYYRCRLFPNCTASGRIYDNKMFHLQQPHGDHPDQESYKESLELFNTLRGKSKDNTNNLNIIYDEECVKQESPQIIDDTKNKLLGTKILKRNRDAFKILTEILGDQDYGSVNDGDRPLNNYAKTEINSIDGLGIRTKIIYSAGHIYLHTSTSTYRCYLYPKCLAAGNLITEHSTSLFQLNVPHSDHGFKDTERDILHFVVAVKKRIQTNPNNMSQIFNEELQKDNYTYLKNKISLDTLIKLFVRLGSYPNDDEDKSKNESDEDTYLEVPRPFQIIDGGSGGHVLFCDDQLYNSNSRTGHYRCRLYQSGCPATGIRENKKFILTKSHLIHTNQVSEKIKLHLTSTLRRRAATEFLPLQTIYNQEMRNPEFKLVSHLLPYHAVYKIMKRARTHGLSADKFVDTFDNNMKKKQKEIPEKVVAVSSDTIKLKSESRESNSSLKFTEIATDSIDEDSTNTTTKTNYRSNKVKNPQFPCMKYSLMEGERLGSCILYCNEQLYTLNRNNYYRCRMYPQGCQATGMREENYFRLCRGHSGHGSQEPERRRIILINTIKKKTMTNPDPDYFESVFNRECEKPEYADVVERVSFTVILNNMRKIWKRYQQQDPTLSRNIMRNDLPEDLHQKMTERESKDKDLQSEQEDTEDFKMAVEVGDDVFCDQDISPKAYTLMEGERLGSCLLYSNQQLYTNNQRNYYRCRMYSIGCRATGIIKDNLFYLLKPHNSHGSQEREVRRLVLITRIKRRAQIDPSRLQTIFNEECSKQEFNDVAEMVNFKKIYSTLDRCRRRAANDVLEVIEPNIPPDIAEKESTPLKNQWSSNISEEQTDHMTEDGVQYFIQNVEDAFHENSENETINPEESYLSVQNDDTIAVIETSKQQIAEEELISRLGLVEPEGGENLYDNENGTSDEITPQGENYEFIGGDRFGSKLLYSGGQLYCLNRDNYFRCRIYPNCIATGRVYGDQFRLHRGHSMHDLQVDEKSRLLFINNLKKRVQENLTTPIKEIFDDECSKPEYNSVAFLVNYKTVFSTLMKCRTRAQMSVDVRGTKKEEYTDQQQSTNHLDILQDFDTKIDKFDNDLDKDDIHDDLNENLSSTWNLDEFSDSDMESLVEVPKPDMNTPTQYTIIQGDRTGSLILYSNGHLYTRNRGSYYRCRLHPACYGSGNRRGNLFYMTRQHNNHPVQDDEKSRLALMNVLKRRVLEETTPLKVIYDEEIIKPEFSAIADLVSFKMIQSTMIKIRERVKYGQEPGTVMLSTEAIPLYSKSEIDENESLDNEEGVDSDTNENEIKNKLEKESSDDRYIYYYVLDYDDTDTKMRDFNGSLGDNIIREYFNSSNVKEQTNEIQATQPIVVYTIDISEENVPLFKRKVHLPDEVLHEEISRTAATSTQNEMQEPLSYTIIEDCLNEEYLLYAGKQLYLKKRNQFFGCRIRTCQAIGQIRDNLFYLLCNHINHPLQNKVKLQLQLIARIKSRCLERRTARVSKIFRHECTRPEFRSVANTITLDGISDMVRKYRRKYFPKITNPPTEMINSSMLSDLPPPVEFSMVNGTTPDVRLLHCGNALFYHSSKGVYRCHVKGCGSFGRRDRIFFQLLSPHIEHEAVDINDKENLLYLIKKIEEDIWKRNLMDDDENENNSFNDETQKLVNQEESQIPQIKFETPSDAIDDEEMRLTDIHEDNQDNTINQSSTKSILQQAWEELQVHI